MALPDWNAPSDYALRMTREQAMGILNAQKKWPNAFRDGSGPEWVKIAREALESRDSGTIAP